MGNLKKKYSKIYDQYIAKIYRFIFIKVNSPEIAEDLTSETFLRGWERLKELNGKIDNLPAFLYQIARNLVVDYYREKNNATLVSADSSQIADPRDDLAEKATFNSDLQIILTAMSSLSDDYREVINLHYLDDLSIKETAQILNRPEGTVRVMLHRALKELREQLKG
jgi:RNA polymerase sigma-70 factor (ECF subfamily)